MQAVDRINAKYGNHVQLAVQGNGREWKLKQELLSKRYTTELSDIIVIKT